MINPTSNCFNIAIIGIKDSLFDSDFCQLNGMNISFNLTIKLCRAIKLRDFVLVVCLLLKFKN